jgi:YHS domain-containing protein
LGKQIKMKKIYSFAVMFFVAICSIYAQKSEVFSTNGIAIKGYDPVAFFKESKPVMGHDPLSYQWKGATWLFSSKENLEAFKAQPVKYAPQYGGYCAYGAAEGHKAPTETNTWTILDDKLYFNYNQEVRGMWMKNHKANIDKANANWDKIKDKE